MAAQLLDTYLTDSAAVVDWFRMRISRQTNASTARSFGWAVDSLDGFLCSRPGELRAAPFSGDTLREWCAWLIINGYARTTISYYLSIIRTLHDEAVREGIAAAAEGLRELQAAVAAMDDGGAPDRAMPSPDDLLAAFRRFVAARLAGSDDNLALRPDSSLGADIVMFSVVSGGLDFGSVASWRKDSSADALPLAAAIAARYARPRCRYLFPLDQGHRTARQLASVVAGLFRSVLAKAGLQMSPDAADTPLELWIRIAYAVGLDMATIKALVGPRADRFPMLAVVRDVPLSAARRDALMRVVHDAIVDTRPEWYAFRFRPGVSYSQVSSRLEAGRDAGDFTIDDTYYPCEEIARRVGDNLVIVRQPVVAGLLFIRCRSVDVASIVRRAGDLMWCYTTRTDRGAVYAVIPPAEMYIYQTTIDLLMPGTDLRPAGDIPLLPGDRVEIVGGSFNGRVGTIAPEDTAPGGGRTIYRLLLPGGSGIEWLVDIPADHLRRINPRHYTRRLTTLSRLTFT